MPAPDSNPLAASEANRSVQRACALLDAFRLDAPYLTLAELASAAGLAKSTTHRLAAGLVQSGYMAQRPDGRYAPGLRLLELGAIVRQGLDIVSTCAPAMERLVAETGETAILGVADWAEFEITIVHRIDSAHPLAVVSPVGRRQPIQSGSLGKALLSGVEPQQLDAALARVDLSPRTNKTIRDPDALAAEIERCRTAGYATERDEFVPGTAGVAAPVLSDGGRPLGALAIVGPSLRLGDKMDAYGELVRAAALSLQHAHPPPEEHVV